MIKAPSKTEMAALLHILELCRQADNDGQDPETELTNLATSLATGQLAIMDSCMRMCQCGQGVVGPTTAGVCAGCLATGEHNARNQERTDKDILDQTEKLARKFVQIQGYELVGDVTVLGLWQNSSGLPAIRRTWDMAAAAQEMLTDTDLNNVYANLETKTPG